MQINVNQSRVSEELDKLASFSSTGPEAITRIVFSTADIFKNAELNP